MNAVKFAVIGNCLLRITLTICITYSAIHFQKPSLLWWYILPAMLGLSVSSKDGKEDSLT